MSSSRIPSLDGIRALSIAMVLASHFGLSLHYPHYLWALANCYGKVGLRIFYVLSGFLITHLLMRERERAGAISLRQFYARRAYRIFPAAYLYMILICVIFRASLSAKDVFMAFTYLSSYQTYIPHPLSHLWSLSVEEQFYLLWPAAMAISVIPERKVAIGVTLLAPVARFILISGGWSNGPLYPIATSADALSAGCLLALFQPQLAKLRGVLTSRRFWIVGLLTSLIPLLDLAGHGRVYQCAAVPLLHAGIALCIQNAIAMRYRVLNAAVPVWAGTISYSLYLWHRPFDDPTAHSWYTVFPANLLCTLVAATASYYLVEQPALTLRSRRVPRLSSGHGDSRDAMGNYVA